MNLIKCVLASSLALLVACSGEDDHGHPHPGGGHPPAVQSSSEHSDSAEHSHGDDTHTHGAPETEAFYGDETAPATDTAAPAVAEEHVHDGSAHDH